VERRLGRGGMGEVFLAYDDRLRRQVAIKRIRHEGPLSAAQRRRFQREAQAAARLNHPAIVQIFDLVADEAGEAGEAGDALVMEYVEGESLAEVRARGPLDPAIAVRLAREIALGLGAAHAAGFVHRDLKSDNVMVTASGRVKILDFGLAKPVLQEDTQGEGDSITSEGVVVGTFHTISPEQARGGQADARSDLFSLGVLIYELVTGQSPFRGRTHMESLRRVLNHWPPPLETVRPGLPRELGALVERLLEKDPRRRPQSAREVAQALEEIAALPGIAGRSASAGEETTLSHPLALSGVAPPGGGQLPEDRAAARDTEQPGQASSFGRAGHAQEPAAIRAGGGREAVAGAPEVGRGAAESIRFDKLSWRLAAVVVVALAAGGGYLLLRSSTGTAASPASAPAAIKATFSQLTDLEGSESFPSISPDGNFFLYCKASGGKSRIYLQRVGGGNPIDLSRGSPESDSQPAFSPDGQQIAFRSERDGGGIFIMGATGESVRRLTDFGYNPAWSPDGSEVLCATEGVADPAIREADSRIWRIDVATGAKRLAIDADAVQPSWSPDGRRIAYWGVPRGTARRVLSTVQARPGNPDGRVDAMPLVDDQYLNWNPVWAPDGKHLYFASNRGGSMNLWRLAVDEATGKPLGEPEALTTPSRWSGLLSIARDGRRILFATRDGRSDLEKMDFDPVAGRIAGPPQAILQGSRYVRSCEVSPDGRRIVFHSQVPQEDLFVVRSDGSDLRQLTNDRYKDRHPLWSPDGSLIAFYSNRSGHYELWTIRPDGSRLEQVTHTQSPGMVYPLWSPNGRWLTGVFLDGRGTALIDLARPPDRRVPVKLPVAADKEGAFSATAWSPDGRWLAGNFVGADEAQVPGVALYSFQNGHRSRLTERGLSPHWLHDSHRLFFFDQGKLFLVDVHTRRVWLALEPPANSTYFWVSSDPIDRSLYLLRQSDEGHIWMLTMS
jgi:Tol biopolymer transport system component/tRNA A-37 threonylcarbamoyl transferase component Bud32